MATSSGKYIQIVLVICVKQKKKQIMCIDISFRDVYMVEWGKMHGYETLILNL